ncbi:DUF1471 domain-containing protein [Erwinia sp. 9145]|uniref:multiple stress resistance protein BhsA n=1 Tax=Erwinia sp. 9145 TaxID=1500895 RepID=UPI0005515891|nr:DUF1471 domain-containing protein [Erwinia sp. 9145]
MKNVTLLIVSTIFSVFAFNAAAAELVVNTPVEQQRAGVISATGSSSLTSLESQLSTKADRVGAKAFRIVSTSGQNNLHGTAIIYN